MKKTIQYIILFVILIIVLAIISAVVWNNYYDEDTMRSCEVDSDCVLVEGGFTCCSCNAAINKEFVDRFSSMPDPYCDNVKCKSCIFANAAVCVENTCQAIYEP